MAAWLRVWFGANCATEFFFCFYLKEKHVAANTETRANVTTQPPHDRPDDEVQKQKENN